MEIQIQLGKGLSLENGTAQRNVWGKRGISRAKTAEPIKLLAIWDG